MSSVFCLQNKSGWAKSVGLPAYKKPGWAKSVELPAYKISLVEQIQ